MLYLAFSYTEVIEIKESFKSNYHQDSLGDFYY